MSNETLLSRANEAKRHGMSYGKYMQLISDNNNFNKQYKKYKANKRKTK